MRQRPTVKHRPNNSAVTTRCMAEPRVSPPGANEPAKLRGYWTKDQKIFTRRRRNIGASAALTRAYVLQSSHPLWNACAQNEGGLCQFSPIRGKNQLPITIATSLKRLRTKCHINLVHPHVYLF